MLSLAFSSMSRPSRTYSANIASVLYQVSFWIAGGDWFQQEFVEEPWTGEREPILRSWFHLSRARLHLALVARIFNVSGTVAHQAASPVDEF